MRLLVLVLALCLFGASLSARYVPAVSDEAILTAYLPRTLSVFGFFNGTANRPAAELISYSLKTPLFSDYAEKQRYLYIPAGKSFTVVKETGQVRFPVGTALIKSFGYRDARGKLNILETRLLLHRASGWIALPYVWRADGSDADLKVGGTRLPVSFNGPDGALRQISYAVPNKNQCKQCHSSNDAVEPIGPVAGNMIFEDRAAADLLAKSGNRKAVGELRFVHWDRPDYGSLEDRAASYLYVNCAHCHRPSGSASNSGLFFDRTDYDAANRGIGKRPVAAGRGSGGFDFVIDPGKPKKSILVHRMKSLDPGVAMPELGRATAHTEGIELLEEWIRAMPAE